MCKEEELLEQQPSEEAAQTMEEDREGEAALEELPAEEPSLEAQPPKLSFAGGGRPRFAAVGRGSYRRQDAARRVMGLKR